MPYFITDKSPDCSGWATIKDDGEVIGCHTTKQDAIDQMVAVSISEDIEVGGERVKKLKVKKAYRELPDNYRPALADDVPEGRACGNCVFYDESRVNESGDKAWCEKWDEFVDGGYYCNAWQEHDESDDDEMNDESDENRAPAPKKEQIKGSAANPEGSAKGSGAGITFNAATTTALKNKVTDHNEAMSKDNRPSWTRASLGSLKSVYRRGAGAYSVSHRPGMTRGQWAMGRVNAYLFLLRNGKPENANYSQDNDLLPAGHPKSSRSFEVYDERAINQSAPSFMRAAARRGLAFYADGLAGDGLTDKTVREARLMADGQVSDDKWIRIAAWIARHMPDLDAPAASPSNENYPSAGVVAHFLWGSGATKQQARRTMEYAERVVERIRADQQDRNAEQNAKWKSIALNLNKDERQQMTTTVERRVNTVEFDVRNGEASSDGMSFTGYAAVFDSPSEPLPFTEVIKGGAFQRSLKSRNEIKLFMNHNTDVVLGSSRAGTLRLSEDSRGLLAEADLPDTTAGRDLSVLMQRGDVNSMSFGFSVPPKGDKWSEDGATRELHQIRLHEVSIVTGFPAYQATTASVRSLDILATRTAVDVDALSDAITRLEAGETLEAEHADLISEVVSKLRAEQPTNLELLELKRKQLDLMAKVF
jgi:HK97 family phage prohead protease